MHSNSHCVQALQHWANTRPTAIAFRFVDDAGNEEAITFAELERRARSIAAWLLALGGRGEPVLLFYPSGLDFIAAFMGCLFAGAVAVPVYPAELTRMERTWARLRGVVADASPRLALTTHQILGHATSLLASYPEFEQLEWLASDKLPDSAEAWRAFAVEPDAHAFRRDDMDR